MACSRKYLLPIQLWQRGFIAHGLVLLLMAWLPSAHAAADAPAHFDIGEFAVVGDHHLGTDAIEEAVYPFLGPDRTVADAEGARKALQKAYQDAGWLSISVVLPPQRIDGAGGVVRLEVVEAKVAQLRVVGAEYHLPSEIRAAVPSVAPEQVPNFNELQQQLGTLAKTMADTQVTPLLAAGEAPQTMNVDLKVQDHLPLHGSVEVNSKQAANTEAGRIEAAISYDNLFQRGHSLGFNWYYSPLSPAQSNIQTLTYALPTGVGDGFSALFTHSDSNTPTALAGATVAKGDTLHLLWRDELPQRPGIEQAASWGLTLHHTENANVGVGGATTVSPSLRYPSFNLGYELTLAPPESRRNTHLLANLNISLGGLSSRVVDCGGTTMDQFACQRSGAPAGFQTFNLTLEHHEPIGRWLFSARLMGQLTDVPLVPGEQVVYGGFDSVRGYYEGEQAGDSGGALRLELLPPPQTLNEHASLQWFGFYDHAMVHKYDVLPGEVGTVQLGSTGLGLRLTGASGLQLMVDWALLLNETNQASSTVPLSGSAAGRGQHWDLSLRQPF